MTTDVRCPDCQQIWQVPDSAEGEMMCPSCMARIPLRAAAAPVPPQRPVSPAASPSRNTAGPDPGAVACPRCQHRFVPRGRELAPPGMRKCALVVDDLLYFRELARDALEPTFDVRSASTAAEARKLLAAGGVDLLVLDLTLEGRDAGRDLLIQLAPKPCPILIFTAQDEADMYGERWGELQRLGADDLVIKGMQVAESLARKAAALVGVAVDEERSIR